MKPFNLNNANPELLQRLNHLREFSHEIRSSEYHITQACNLRCKGCWFFEFEFDKKAGKDEKEIKTWREFAKHERERGVTLAILIGGEPSLWPERIKAFADHMPYIWISTNGLEPLPIEDFPNIAISITLFGGGPLDDELRGIRPGGKRIYGLFDTALKHYHNDKRAFFVYALTRDSRPHIEDVVKRIADNGNQVLFNYYSEYGGQENDPVAECFDHKLLDTAIAMKEKYPQTVLSHPYYIRTLITGKSHWRQWDYEVCPSISQDHPANRERLKNGNPALPGFNAYSQDLKTINKCCTSGHCENCRDSQAVMSWLLVSMKHFMDNEAHLQTWLELSESFWSQFCWSPYHKSHQMAGVNQAAVVIRKTELNDHEVRLSPERLL